MTSSDKARLLELLENFCDGKLSADSFSDEFTTLYTQEIDYEQLNEADYNAFRELNAVTSRFSPFQEDLERYDCYYSAAQVREKANEVLGRVGHK